MNQEEFQKKVLEQLGSINSELVSIKSRLDKIEDNQRILIEQTKGLTEFKQAVKDTANNLIKKIS